MTKTLSDSALRSRANRQGFTLIKSRAALSCDNQGGYQISDQSNIIVAGEKFDLTAEDVQKFLNSK